MIYVRSYIRRRLMYALLRKYASLMELCDCIESQPTIGDIRNDLLNSNNSPTIKYETDILKFLADKGVGEDLIKFMVDEAHYYTGTAEGVINDSKKEKEFIDDYYKWEYSAVPSVEALYEERHGRSIKDMMEECANEQFLCVYIN